eukprot:CAMPEP_0197615256 /NCGR_PEP_ID=MMETSP1326-20131121/59939_1 /TAXON_ID=1155430 /ORGANISM="Genus nov. species nov., Strain RCC2288" /LENGTH=170 /DNA_ID=CAMNT_0043184137 /DNA_START=492 /DNA_END=1002 /DNA_ORIENTATION=+
MPPGVGGAVAAPHPRVLRASRRALQQRLELLVAAPQAAQHRGVHRVRLFLIVEEQPTKLRTWGDARHSCWRRQAEQGVDEVVNPVRAVEVLVPPAADLEAGAEHVDELEVVARPLRGMFVEPQHAQVAQVDVTQQRGEVPQHIPAVVDWAGSLGRGRHRLDDAAAVLELH